MNNVIETLPEGAPFYDWKQDKMSRTERAKFIKQVYVFTRFIQMMFLFCLLWLLYFITSKILHVICVH
ncbi:hypothetical protein TNCV_3675671 [Trichonephila clavipes]|nr:hypothetical protein TNCV_3675671 [Trichonephila clavipes]